MEFLIYLGKSSIILSLFYLVYILFLAKETFFQGIRLYFWIGTLATFILPLIEIKRTIFVDAIALPVSSGLNNPSAPIQTPFDWNGILMIVYFIGLVLLTSLLTLRLISLFRLIANEKKTNWTITFGLKPIRK